ncbi:uncharacterized protein I206_103816 [Kwoniella pini CBS 10737]|uniref:U1 small nuclear ribonucleoprotein C n=1 Tax=Kwoniella pini CBS 10737 TaxID=1296096 RepID=A0A1B9HSQ4_9TREE|nr:U1 small nuclear ribonucleoprotein C [Kwoniella pini CBS 10737]OCF46288.1 U1 small nuclear ribonucleoprotein C [Kwoniella pini CBS 10737]
MGKYYCDYCDIYLTHDSMNARKAHNTGRNHVANVRDYFAGLNHDKAQNIIDQIISQHETGGPGMGGRGGPGQMMMAPSMRIGAGFLNPMPANAYPPSSYPPPPSFPQNQNSYPPQNGSFRPPFPPNGQLPPFPPSAGSGPGPGNTPNSFPPNFSPSGGFASPGGPNGAPFRPPPSSIPNGFASPPGLSATATAPPPIFTQASEPPAGAAPGIHPDRLRMLGTR